MKKASCLSITIGIIISLLFTIFVYFFIAPLYLSLDIFGIQDAVYQYPSEVYAKFYIELSFYFIFGISYIVLLVIMLITAIKTSLGKIKLSKAKTKAKNITIVSMISIIIYSIGTLIVNYINNSNHVQWRLYLFTLTPVIIYVLITFYFSFAILLSIKNNDLKEIEDNTI